MLYRGFTITHNPKPIPTNLFDYDYVHPNEDGSGNWSGTAKTEQECKEVIDEMIKEYTNDGR